MGAAPDSSFLAPPGEVIDWRMTVLFDTAVGTGALNDLPATAEDIALARGLDPHGLRVMFDALAAWEIVERTDDGRYRLGAAAPDASTAATIRHQARAIDRWSSALSDRIRGATGAPPTTPTDPEVFLDALAVNARRAAPGLVELCLERFPEARRVLDLGGLHGEYSLEFARRGLEVTMQDLPRMIDVVKSRGYLAEAGVELFAASFFDEVPAGPFDLAFCCGITHTFDGDRNLTLYRNLRPAIAAAGGVAVVTTLRNRHPMGDVFAVQMYVNGNGGDSHPEEDYRTWLGAAGFTPDAHPTDLPGRPQSVIFAS
jgi:hypothetical protein